MKQLNSLRREMEGFKEALEREKITFEDENFKIVANAAGEILELEIKNPDCSNLSEKLKGALNEVNRKGKERVKELAKGSLFGQFFGGQGMF